MYVLKTIFYFLISQATCLNTIPQQNHYVRLTGRTNVLRCFLKSHFPSPTCVPLLVKMSPSTSVPLLVKMSPSTSVPLLVKMSPSQETGILFITGNWNHLHHRKLESTASQETGIHCITGNYNPLHHRKFESTASQETGIISSIISEIIEIVIGGYFINVYYSLLLKSTLSRDHTNKLFPHENQG